MRKNLKDKIRACLVAAIAAAVFALCGCGGSNVIPAPAPNDNGGSKTVTLAEIVEANERLAVEVATVSETGTGTIIAADDETVTIATCYHLTGYDAAHTEFRFCGETAFTGSADAVELVGYSAQFDIAIFKVKKGRFDAGKIAGFAEGLQKKGTGTVALGNAYGLGIAAFEGVVSLPETVESEENFYKPMIRVTVAGNPGNSGAPILTADGKLLGMVLGKRTGGEAMTYVLPISIINALYENALGGTENGNINYTAIKFESGETTENDVTAKNTVVTLGTGETAVRIGYAGGEFIKKIADGQSADEKVKQINGVKVPSNLIDFTAEAVRKNKVSLTAGNFSQEI